MKKKQIFIALALVVAVAGAFSTKANSRSDLTTYYDKSSGSCNVTTCSTNTLNPQCSQQFWSDATCLTSASVTLYRP